MKFSALSALGLLAPLLAHAVPLDRPDDRNVALKRGDDGDDCVTGKYIVQLKHGVAPDKVKAHHAKVKRMLGGLDDAIGQAADNLSDGLGDAHNVGDLQDTVEETLEPLVDYLQNFLQRTFGFGDWSAYELQFNDPSKMADQLEKIRCQEEVDFVEPDRRLQLSAVATQPGSTWNLGSVSHRGTNSTDYVRDDSLGAGTYAYVVDTGVRATHQELAGRVTMGYNAINGSEDGDTVGHGTHVAGTIAGSTLGVSGRAEIIDVKVFGSESGSTSDGIDGFQWAVNDIITKGRQDTAVINLSLGASSSTAWDNAVIHAREQGVLTTCAAGNSGTTVDSYSPGRTTQCLTVGNAMEDLTRHPTSNYGPAVDLFAPGTHIVSASYESDTGTLSKSGTSMATPVIAGLVCYLRGLEGASSPDTVVSRIIDLSTKNLIKDPRDCPNRLAFNGVSS